MTQFPSDEVWKIVPSLPWLEASSYGRLRVIPYKRAMPYGGTKMVGGIPTFGQWDGERFIYNRGGKDKTYKVARLICETFNGPPPFPKAICMHIDENAKNNQPNNLKWGTQKENLNYPGFIKYCKNRTGKNNPFIKGRNNGQSAEDCL